MKLEICQVNTECIVRAGDRPDRVDDSASKDMQASPTGLSDDGDPVSPDGKHGFLVIDNPST